MRTFVVSFLLLLAVPVLAAGWGSYENARFGYVVDVPPGYQWGPEAKNGDGRAFVSADGTRSVSVHGGHVLEEDFESAARAEMGYARDAGWSLADERLTPSWASYAGRRNGLLRQVRMIALCEATQYAAVTIDYPERDVTAMARMADRLALSLRGTGNCW